ncbi:hypothetical protein ES708_34142 [subsurface metagenome]
MAGELPQRVVGQVALSPDHTVVPVPPGVEGELPPAPFLLWGSDPVDVVVEGFPHFPQELPAASYSSASVAWPRTVMRRKYRCWGGRGRIGGEWGGKITREILGSSRNSGEGIERPCESGIYWDQEPPQTRPGASEIVGLSLPRRVSCKHFPRNSVKTQILQSYVQS